MAYKNTQAYILSMGMHAMEPRGHDAATTEHQHRLKFHVRTFASIRVIGSG